MVHHHRGIASAIALTLALAGAAPAIARLDELNPLPGAAQSSAPASSNLCSEVCSASGYTTNAPWIDPSTERGATLPHNPRSRSAAVAPTVPAGPRSEVASGGGYGNANAPASVVRVVVPSNGFDWGDAGIGAGGAVALMLLILVGVLGVSNVRRHTAGSTA